MKHLLDKIHGDIGIYAQNLNTNEVYSLNHEKVFPSASVIKLPILYLLYKKISENSLDIETKISFSEKDIVDDSPYFLENNLISGQVGLYDVAHSMITVSDNTSTNLLIDLLSFEEINKIIKQMGLNNTILQRKMCDFETRKKGIDNLTTAYDMAMFFYNITPLISSYPYDLMFKIITEQKDLEKIPSGFVNENIIIANKPGELDGVRSDVALLIKNDTKIVISVMTENVKNEVETDEIIGQISKRVFDFLS